MRRILAVVVGALLAGGAAAQDPPEDAAARLKRIVDERLAELRLELHREIDAMFGSRPAGLTVVPASAEFRQVHRLPANCGVRVVEGREAADGDRPHLRNGDVILSVGGEPVGSLSDVEKALASASGVSGHAPLVSVIRKGERKMVWFLPVPAGVLTGPRPEPAPETAEQILDRLWDNAVKQAIPGGAVQLGGDGKAPESQPVEKNLIPAPNRRR